MLYKIVPAQPVAAVIDAESPEAAMDGFAWSMDDDMGVYFKAVVATEKDIEEYCGQTKDM